MRDQSKALNAAEASFLIDAIDGIDPDGAHSEADDILLRVVPDEVHDAYVRLMDRCSWWATA